MGRSRQAAEPGNGAARERAALSDRERAADERQARAGTRETLAGERERLADQREREADQREALLDRERQEADEREKDLDERGRRLDRQESAVKRAQARRDRQQADVDRATAETERGLTGWLPGPAKPTERAKALREQALRAIEAFAAHEEEIARIHEDLAASTPSRRDEYRRVAEQARQTARKAREILRAFAG